MSATPKVAVSDVKAALVARVGDSAVTTASEDLDAYTADTYWPALAAAAAGTPLAKRDDVFTVLPGTLAQDELERRLRSTDAVVVIKLGRNLPKVRRALERSGRAERALYVERGTMSDEKAIPLADKSDDCAPYFAMVLVPGWERRP